MERQIMIKHQKVDTTSKIKTIISYLELFVGSNDKIICNCCLNVNQSSILDEIKHLEQYYNVEIINVEANKKHYNYDVVICFKNFVHILNIIEKYELNVMISCNDIKIFINDNDGDFIIINSNHEKYNAIKNN